MNASALIRPTTCSTCAFKFRNGQELQCRRNPPNAVPLMGQRGNQPVLLGTVTVYPIVQSDWWCGQFSKLTEHNFAADTALAS